MALVKCKECGSQVSTKAKVCPKCGAKAPKKTSLFTWLVLVIILVSVYNVFTSGPSSTATSTASSSNTETTKTSSTSSENSTGGGSAAPEVKAPEWTTFNSTDEMTGEQSSFAISPKTGPTRPMGFPYGGVEARLAIGCDASSEWAYINFSQAPNLNDTETKDGYNLIRTRVRWDDSVVTETLTQEWGSEFIRFRNRSSTIQKIAGSSSVMIELKWHTQGAVRFPFTLNGSSSALQKIRQRCASY